MSLVTVRARRNHRWITMTGTDLPPLVIELFSGLFGWCEAFVANGFRSVGVDIVKMGPVPAGCALVIQDVLTLHGSQFRDAAVIVASPPCQKYSYLAMPWSRSTDPNNSKAAKALRNKWETDGPDNRLFDACFRIQREAIEATRKYCIACEGLGVQAFPFDDCDCKVCDGKGYSERYIPLIVENVCGAQPWVGRSAWNYGKFHLWGDVPALMPFAYRGQKTRGNWFARRMRADGSLEPHANSHDFPPDYDEQPQPGIRHEDRGGVKVPSEEGRWTDVGKGARFTSRKAASAQIAKIPFELADWIAKVYKPREI